MGLRSYDAFARPVEGLRERSTVGGVITVIAAGTAAILFSSQIVVYSQLRVSQHFRLAPSHTQNIEPVDPRNRRQTKLSSDPLHRIRIKIHLTFPYMRCADLQVSMDNLPEEHVPVKERLHRRIPTPYETKKIGLGSSPSDGCTLFGTLDVPRVGGSVAVTVSPRAWMETTSIFRLLSELGGNSGGSARKMHNVTHYVHDVEFGERFPHAPNPLHDTLNVFDNHHEGVHADSGGIGLCAVAVKLVGVRHKRFGRQPRDTYQTSVTQHMVQSQTLAEQGSRMLPGLSMVYDFTPFRVHHTESRDNVLTFLSDLVSVVAGVFVTVGLVSSCLLSAVNVGKKVD